MSVSNIGASSSPTPPQAQDTSGRRASDGGSGAQLPADRVEISDAANAQAAADGNGVPSDYYWTPHLYPGQRGYVPPPLSTQFDKDGRFIKPGTNLDTDA
jgi:hypothetical protein